jgi:hypothetical protein
MDQEIKTKWVAALRSGNYKQGRYVLRDESGFYCCLGVLCEVIGDEIEPTEAYLSVARRNELGLNADHPGTEHSEQSHLAHMNDDGKSFAEIADYIEANL